VGGWKWLEGCCLAKGSTSWQEATNVATFSLFVLDVVGMPGM
jgi:hypothetical protein